MLTFKVYVIMFTIIIVSSFWDVQAVNEVGSSSGAPLELPVPDGVTYEDVTRNCMTFLQTFSTFSNDYTGDQLTYRNTKTGNTIRYCIDETGQKLLSDFRQHYWQYLLGNDELLAKQISQMYGEYLYAGKIFPKEDEEGEMFNHSCLADLKQGRVRLNDNKKQYNERLSELQARNSLCPPHLRSCYAAETNFLPNTSLVSEEDINTTANYSDYETENLIPNDRTKKKDRNQTSYKKPGPPTPSKNGGRVSLSTSYKKPGPPTPRKNGGRVSISSNPKIALKESKEINTNKRPASSTPNKLFGLFMSKKN